MSIDFCELITAVNLTTLFKGGTVSRIYQALNPYSDNKRTMGDDLDDLGARLRFLTRLRFLRKVGYFLDLRMCP